jgi:hypothetical protein
VFRPVLFHVSLFYLFTTYLFSLFATICIEIAREHKAVPRTIEARSLGFRV